jgi:hypothetical protein
MPKFKVKAYEEVYYEGEVEAEDQDEAQELFMDELGEYHKFQTKHNFTLTEVKKLKENQNA